MRILLLALRNLSRQKRRSFLLGGALAFGFLVLTLVNGCAGGVAYGFEKNVSALATGHLFYFRVDRSPETNRLRLLIPSDREFLQALEQSKVKPRHVIRRSQSPSGSTMIFAGKASSRSLEGIDWNNDPLLTSNLTILKGSLDGLAGSDGVVIAESLSESLAVEVGDRVLIQTLTIDGQQNVDEFEVRAIYQDAASTFQVSSFLDREALNRLIGLPAGGYNTLGIFLDDIWMSHEAQQKIHRSLSQIIPPTDRIASLEDLRTQDPMRIIQRLRQDEGFTQGGFHLVTALEDLQFFKSFRGTILAVQWGSALVTYFLMVLIMVGLVNTFRLIVQERRREIGTLRALGMQRNEVLSIFIWEAVLLSVLGALVGFLLGVAMLWFIGLGENLWFLPELGEIAFFTINRRLAWQLNLGVLVVSAAVLVVMTLLAVWAPANRAARLNPAEALRQ